MSGPLRIGLTGGIGSGKSTIARYLVELGARHIDSDKVGHDAFRPGMPLYDDIIEAFGPGVVGPDGQIDRPKLGQIVFTDRAKLDRLNRIMWPRMKEMVRQQIEQCRREGAPAVVVEVPLLIEAGWTDLVDEVWVAVVSPDVVVERLKANRKQSEEETRRRIGAQLSNAERVKHADVVISNDGSPEEVKAKVKALWEQRIAK